MCCVARQGKEDKREEGQSQMATTRPFPMLGAAGPTRCTHSPSGWRSHVTTMSPMGQVTWDQTSTTGLL